MLPRQAPLDILDDLCSRFIINIPEEERKDPIRLCFQVELAYWFYLDFYCPENPAYPQCNMREFTQMIFQHVPSLQEHLPNLDAIIDSWKEYKMAVPTFGAIVLDETLEHVLLVQSYWARATWGFPKGKVNEGEEPHVCAAREVLEETGYDITPLLSKNEFIERQIHDQVTRLYIIAGVPMDTQFSPRTRKEIKSIEWFAIADLPSHKRDQAPRATLGMNANAFFMVMPFVKHIRKWIFNSRHRRLQQQLNDGMPSITDTEKLKQKQQQYFASLYQNELADILRQKECSGPAATRNGVEQSPRHRRSVVPLFSALSWTRFSLDRSSLAACFCA
ncbi:m7GpppN-mRNA hydrolase-like [Dermacentor variabilis]|uniref:m7GpppN-mRNA hydrolase-like n=1 Tax=Dermacentor variabilis TaxID=34621 RepID=UPI003F5C3770